MGEGREVGEGGRFFFTAYQLVGTLKQSVKQLLFQNGLLVRKGQPEMR